MVKESLFYERNSRSRWRKSVTKKLLTLPYCLIILTYIELSQIELFSQSHLPTTFSSNIHNINVYFAPKSSDDQSSSYANLTNLVVKARKSIYLVAYGFDLYELTELLIEKRHEGLNVEVMIEKDSLSYPLTRILIERMISNQIKVSYDLRNSGIMHNKFLIIDRKIVLTGSSNFTLNGYFHHYNDILIIKSKAVAQHYLKKFLELSDPYFQSKVGKFKNSSFRYSVDYNEENKQEETVNIYFSRSDEPIKENILLEIENSQKYINFMVFVFSDWDIANALKVSQSKNKTVKGIFDNSFESKNITHNWRAVPFQILWLAGADVKYDNEDSKVHHKSLIIDESTVITGSFNYSRNAVVNNNENIVIIRSKRINQLYHERFRELYNRFPSRTPFEEYISKKKKLRYSYDKYLRVSTKKENKLLKNTFTTIGFPALVKRVISGNSIQLEITINKKRYRRTVKLLGIKTPLQGNDRHHQQPQAGMIKEFIARKLVQKKVWVNSFQILSDYPSVEICIKKNMNIAKKEKCTVEESINYQLLENGFAYLDNDIEKVMTELKSRWRKKTIGYKNFSKLTERLRRIDKSYQSGRNKAVVDERYLYGEHQLVQTPFQFENDFEARLVSEATLENRWSISYRKGSVMGNRVTKRAYLNTSSIYNEHLKNLKNPKLIFFPDLKAASNAGYRFSR